MPTVTQVAFQLDRESLAGLDRLASSSSRSRAEVLRVAVHEFLIREREEQIDAQIEAAYAATPQGPEDDAAARASVQGLRGSDLDW